MNEDFKSKKVMFIAECLLNQNIRAYGVKAKKGSGPLIEIVSELHRNDIGLDVIGCPEIELEGLKRKAAGRTYYDDEVYREICRNLAQNTLVKYNMYVGDDYKVGGVICVNWSPSCGSFQYSKKDVSRPPGIFVEEFDKVLRQEGIKLPFLGVEVFNMNYTMSKLKKLIRNMD